MLGAVEDVAVEQLLAHRPQGMRGHAVLLDVTAWAGAGATGSDSHRSPDPAQAARLLIMAGWSVTVARPEQPLSSVWDQVCLSSRTTLRAPQ